MINLIHAEFYKLRKSTALKICFLITAVCAVVLGGLANGIEKGTVDVPVSSLSGLSDIFIMSVIGTLMASILICSDFESKNIHDAISCGRRSIILSKTVAYIYVIAILLLPYALVGFIGYITKGQYNDALPYSTYLTLMANTKGAEVDAGNIGKAIEILLINVLLYAARFSFCLPIAFKVRKAIVVTVIGVVVGFLSDFFVNILSKVAVLDTILDFTPFSYQMITMDMNQSELVKILLVSVVFIGVMVWLSYALFKKDEIK